MSIALQLDGTDAAVVLRNANITRKVCAVTVPVSWLGSYAGESRERPSPWRVVGRRRGACALEMKRCKRPGRQGETRNGRVRRESVHAVGKSSGAGRARAVHAACWGLGSWGPTGYCNLKSLAATPRPRRPSPPPCPDEQRPTCARVACGSTITRPAFRSPRPAPKLRSPIMDWMISSPSRVARASLLLLCVLGSDHDYVLEADSTRNPTSEHADIMLTMPAQRHSRQVL